MSNITNTTLRAEEVSIRFGGVQALNKVSLEAQPGQITGLIGPNGAGKSTMLGCISGTLEQNEGTILIGQTSVGKTSPQKRASMGTYLPGTSAGYRTHGSRTRDFG